MDIANKISSFELYNKLILLSIIVLCILLLPATIFAEGKYHFYKQPYVHPEKVKALLTPLSGESKIKAVSLSGPVAGNIKTVTLENGKTFIKVEKDRESFGYYLVGTTESSINVLYTSEWGEGSGIFKSLMLVQLEGDLLKKVGEYGLGDRYNGSISVEGEKIHISKDVGWFTKSGGTGGGRINKDITISISDFY